MASWSDTQGHSDLLLKIFTLIPQQFLYSTVSHVNSHWRSLAMGKSLWESVDLDIDDLSIRQDAVGSLLDIIGPKLKSLRLRVGSNLQPAIFTVIPTLPSLTALEFRYEHELDPTTVAFVVSQCPKVEAARFCYCKELVDDDLLAMAKGWTNLHSISVANCPKITPKGLDVLGRYHSGSLPVKFDQLVLVDFEGIDNTRLSTYRVLLDLSSQRRSLKSLRFTVHKLPDVIIQEMKSFGLKELSITFALGAYCSDLHDLQHLGVLRHLHLDFNRPIWNWYPGKEEEEEKFFDISHMSDLRCCSINPSVCTDVLPSFTTGCPLLQSFTYGQPTTALLQDICENMRHLVILRLFKTDDLNLEIFNSVPHKNLPRLKYLELKGTNNDGQASAIEDLLLRTVGLFVCLMSSGSSNLRQNVSGVIVAKSERERVEFLRSISPPCCKNYSDRNAFDYFKY